MIKIGKIEITLAAIIKLYFKPVSSIKFTRPKLIVYKFLSLIKINALS